MPLGRFQLRICYHSMKCCSLPRKQALPKTSLFQEPSGVCLHQVFWSSGAHSEFSTKPQPILSAPSAADTNGTAIIQVGRRNGNVTLMCSPENMKSLTKLKQMEENIEWLQKILLEVSGKTSPLYPSKNSQAKQWCFKSSLPCFASSMWTINSHPSLAVLSVEKWNYRILNTS